MKKFLTAVLCAAVLCSAVLFSACNESQQHTHSWNEGEVTVEATCAKTGIMTYTCSECGETKTEIIEKTEHPHSDKWLYNDDEHWHAATCEHDTERVNAGAHVWDEGTVVKAATCLRTGVMRYSCMCGFTRTEIIEKTEHPYSEIWSHDDDKHWRECTTQGCGEITAEGAHNWDGGVITTPPTCIAEGVKTYTCSVCKMTKTETVGVVDHSFDEEWSSDESGHFHVCTTQGCMEKTETVKHTYGDWVKKGQMAKICSVCGFEMPAPALTSGETQSQITITVGGGETAGATIFTRGLGNYYAVSYTGSAPVKVVCEYYDRVGEFFNPEYTLTEDNPSFTVKLPDRSVAYLTITSVSETMFTGKLSMSVDDKAPGHTHNFDTEWSTNETHHWHACTGAGCEEEADAGLHDFGAGDVCSVCGYDRKAATE